MNIEQKASEILLLLGVRGVGHTYLMVNGLKNSENALLIVQHHQHKRFIEDMCERKLNNVVSLSNMSYDLRGRRGPVAIDHAAMASLIKGMEEEIVKLRRENYELKWVIGR